MFALDRKRLPPIASLTAFEAAARLGNFTDAANELSLTPGATPRMVVSDHLMSKELVEVTGKPLKSHSGFYFLYPKYRETWEPLTRFRDWLLTHRET